MTDEEMQAEAVALNTMTDEVLSLNVQSAWPAEHIGAAETLLALYERSAKLQLTAALQQGVHIEGEGALSLFRRAAETHLKIAATKIEAAKR